MADSVLKGAFPSQVVSDKEKITQEYGLKVAKAIESEWFNRDSGTNRFYNNHNNSSIKLVLNSNPSTIKTFNTLNYEGSQAYIKKPLSATPTEFGDTLHPDMGVTIHNVQAWNSGADIDGWNCTEIKTDMDTGSVVEFIKKEGKWFNYIKGKTMDLNSPPDTSRFSVQGIGEVNSTNDTTQATSGNGNGDPGPVSESGTY